MIRRVYDLADASQRLELIKKKRSALSRLNSGAASRFDREAQREIEIKRAILASSEKAFAERGRSVFISFTGNGHQYLAKAGSLFRRMGFEVRTGFDEEVEKGGQLADEIIARIRSSSIFLAIWTQDFSAESHRGNDGRGNLVVHETGGIPGVWMPFELGVAAAERKPFKLLYERGMHRLYFEKPLGSRPHIPFTREDFAKKLKVAAEALNERYQLLQRSVHERAID